jgi:hypothetical protein
VRVESLDGVLKFGDIDCCSTGDPLVLDGVSGFIKFLGGDGFNGVARPGRIAGLIDGTNVVRGAEGGRQARFLEPLPPL